MRNLNQPVIGSASWGSALNSNFSAIQNALSIIDHRTNLCRNSIQVMASPPTITYGSANAVSSLNGNAAYVYSYAVLTNGGTGSATINTTGPFRWSGATAIRAGASYPDYYYAMCDITRITALYAEMMYAIEFEFYGAAFEVGVKGLAGLNFQVFVDDQPIALAANIPGTGNIPVTGSHYRIKYTFANTSQYRIRIEAGVGCHIGGIDVASGADLMFPSWTGFMPKCIVLGDSWTQGSGTDTMMGPASWVFEMGRALLWNCWNSGAGSTGYLNNGGGGGNTTFRGRVENDVIDQAPDIVVVQGGYNDRASSPSAIQDEAELLYNDILTGLPNSLLFVVGIQSPGAPDGTATNINNALSAACVNVSPNIGFISILDAFKNLTGSTWFGGDNTHPTDLGYHWVGRYIAGRILPFLDV